MTRPLHPSPILAVALLLSSSAAAQEVQAVTSPPGPHGGVGELGGGHGHDEGPHYFREPHTVLGVSETVEEFVISSDENLSVVVIREGGTSGQVLAVTNDGRGLENNWSAPVRISEATNVPRALDEQTSVVVFEDQAFAAWLDDRDGAGATRIHFNRYDMVSGTWQATPLVLDDAQYPPATDVVSLHMAAQRGIAGGIYVYVMAVLRSSVFGLDFVGLHLSPDGGASFGGAQDVAPGTVLGNVGGVSVSPRFGELHLAWTADGAGSEHDLMYRRAIVDFAGDLNFFSPIQTLSTGAGTSVLGEPVIETNGTLAFTGSQQSYVGIAYRQDDGDGTGTLHVATSRDNGNTFFDLVVGTTAAPGVNVSSFDFEIPGETFVMTWQDDSAGDEHVYRAESDTGLTIPVVVQMSGIANPLANGVTPCISPSIGTPDGAVIAWVEDDGTGEEVRTAFGDQFFGGEWHDDFPQVSEAQGDGPVRLVDSPKVAYNELYYNFIVGWRREVAGGTGLYELQLGGYRPPQVVLEGWELGSTEMFFEVLHLPFQDTFGFVLVSGQPPVDGPGFVDYLGRRTGFVSDALTFFFLDDLSEYFFFENDPTSEGGATMPLPLPPLAGAPPLTFMAVSWGPFGDIHTITEPFVQDFGPGDGSL